LNLQFSSQVRRLVFQLKWGRSRRRRKAGSSFHGLDLCAEVLEVRQLLSGAAVPAFGTGTQVDATPGNDTIVVTNDAGNAAAVDVSINGVTQVVLPTKGEIDINGLAGDDQITVDVSTLVPGLNILATDPGSGSNTVNLENTPAGLATITANSQGGIDTVNVG